jgi:hypothetical protein
MIMMNKICVLVGVGGLLSAAALQASMSVTLIDNTSEYSYSNGGEFRGVGSSDLDAAINWNAYSSKTSGTMGAADVGSWGYPSDIYHGQKYFQTFCIEYNEEFNPGTPYSVGISEKAMYGSQPPNGDPLSIGTAWLYSQFAKGTLSGYNYNYGAGRQDSADAGALQQAIWWLEDEPNGVDNSFVTLAETTLTMNDAQIKADANGLYGVRALNLGAPGQVQDQLVIVPETTTLIAGVMMLLPFGASTLRFVRKNRAA